MPKFDGTGPRGLGPMTGRGLGPCGRGQGGFNCPFGRGLGFGSGHGRFISPQNELSSLQEEEKMLEEELAVLKEEIVSLKKQAKSK